MNVTTSGNETIIRNDFDQSSLMTLCRFIGAQAGMQPGESIHKKEKKKER